MMLLLYASLNIGCICMVLFLDYVESLGSVFTAAYMHANVTSWIVSIFGLSERQHRTGWILGRSHWPKQTLWGGS